MHRVHHTYTLGGEDSPQRDLHHPLMALLAAFAVGALVGRITR